ncbi:MAG: hypothetical protein ACLFQ5_04240 [Oceanicaulis sp.]
MKVISVAGLSPIVCACTLAAFSVAGCASGPIDMVSGPPDEARVLEAQASLRETAALLTEAIDQAGWSLTPPPGAQARSFLGRLIGGGDAEADPGADPVSAYLAEAATVQRIAADITSLTERARSVSQTADAVAAAPEGLSRTALERDIAAAEGALGALRRAKAFFAAVGERVDGGNAAVTDRLAALRQAEAGLADAADALAERRWTGHGVPLSG